MVNVLGPAERNHHSALGSNIQKSLQDDELQEALAENTASLHEIQQLRKADPRNAELEQLERELSEAVQALQQGLTANAPSLEAEGEQVKVASLPDLAESSSQFQQNNPAESGRPAKKQRVQRQQPRMHPSNHYAAEEPDFAALAREYPELQPFVRAEHAGRASLAFDNPDANRSELEVDPTGSISLASRLPIRHVQKLSASLSSEPLPILYMRAD